VNEARRADLAYFASTAVALGVLAAFGALQQRLSMIGSDDLSRIWAGPRAYLIGADPYDPATWAATARALGTLPPDTPVYIYPPWVALALIPLGALPLNVASIAFLLGSVTAAVVGLRALLRTYVPGRPMMHALAAAMLLLSWVGALSLIIGQWGYLLVAALSTIVVLLRGGRPAPAGVAAIALIVKPQLFVLAAPALAAWALWPVGSRRVTRSGVRFVTTALVTTVAIVAVSWLVLPSWWPTWLVQVGGVQLGPDSDTVPGLLAALGGADGPRFAPLVLLALVAVALRFHPRSDAWLPVWLTLSLVAAPYTNSYDQILLVVPIVIACGVALRRSVARARMVMGVGATTLIVVTPLMYELAVRRHSETFGVLVPLTVFAVIVATLWPQARVVRAALGD
jgi:hypothetical protein